MSGHNAPHKVLVIGGGYAGTLAANRLRGLTGIETAAESAARGRRVTLVCGGAPARRLGPWKIRREVREPGSPIRLKGGERVVAAA